MRRRQRRLHEQFQRGLDHAVQASYFANSRNHSLKDDTTPHTHRRMQDQDFGGESSVHVATNSTHNPLSDEEEEEEIYESEADSKIYVYLASDNSRVKEAMAEYLRKYLLRRPMTYSVSSLDSTPLTASISPLLS